MWLFYTNESVTLKNTLKINSCTGGIYKTYKESWFDTFELDSGYGDTLLKPYDNSVRTGSRSSDFEKVVILQMVMCGEKKVIAELIREKDFNKYFEANTLPESYDASEHKKSDKELLMDELVVAKKILSDPCGNIQFGTISGIVKQIMHTLTEFISDELARISHVISSWENALLNGYEDSITLERGYEATDRTRILIIYKLISEDLISSIKKYDNNQSLRINF